MSSTSTTPARQLQLQYFRQPLEIIDPKSDEPIQVIPTCYCTSGSTAGFSATKQAFLQMANSCQLVNLEDFNDSDSEDSDPEILLSDSDEDEDEDQGIEGANAEADATTAIDSQDLNQQADDLERMDDLDVFELPFNSETEAQKEADAQRQASESF